jgi:hypothetical protein
VISMLEFLIDSINSVDGGYMRERSWFRVIQKIFWVFQNPHVIYATTRVNSFTIFLLSLFYCRQNLCQVNRQFFRQFIKLLVIETMAQNLLC